MKHIEYITHDVCTKKITFEIDDNKQIHNLAFFGGCNGNLKAIAKLLEGMDGQKAVDLLKGNTCGLRDTSCADQLAIAIESAL